MADADARRPFLVPVMADRLWMYPIPAYCRRPDERRVGETIGISVWREGQALTLQPVLREES